MVEKSLIFIVNPGSASRKYALFIDGHKQASLHFELVDGKVVGHLYYAGGQYSAKYDDSNLANTPHRALPLLRKYKVIGQQDKITAIGIRVVAPSRQFMKDLLVTDEVEASLDRLRLTTPIHIKTSIAEIKQLRVRFPGTPIIAISDSAFHSSKPEHSRYYGFDTVVAEKFGIEKYGFHGVSVGSVVRHLKENKMLLPKTIVCHLGSGSSLTAVVDGKSVDNTMGYSPLEGLMMSTRSGSIDIVAALALKKSMKWSDDELETYLNKKSGLLGVSGVSDDIRQLVINEARSDKRSKLALDMFVHRIKQAIGQMAASMGGVNCLVFTGTVSERSYIIRGRVLGNLDYLGFSYSPNLNKQTYEPNEVVNIASHTSKPILVIPTDEAAELARRTLEFIKK